MRVSRLLLIPTFVLQVFFVYAQNTFPENGNVGIGSPTPQKVLDVNTGHNNYATIGNMLVQGQYSGLHFGYYEPSNTYYRKSAIVFERVDAAARGNIHILNNASNNPASASLSDARLTINYDGNVGIGNTSPTTPLDVSGDLTLRNYNNTENGGTSIHFSSYGSESFGPKIRSSLAYASGINSRSKLILSSYWHGYKDEITLVNGMVGIGTSTPREALSVNGSVRAKEVKVEAQNWPDYVFEPSYTPASLSDLEKFIKSHKHLPEIPSAKEVEENGVSLGEMNAKLLQKIEELTLHLIKQNKRNEEQDKRIAKQQREIEKLKDLKR